MDEIEQAVADAAHAYREARDRADAARDDMTRAVRAAHAAGITEYRLAKITGANRSVIRQMLGKPR